MSAKAKTDLAGLLEAGRTAVGARAGALYRVAPKNGGFAYTPLLVAGEEMSLKKSPFEIYDAAGGATVLDADAPQWGVALAKTADALGEDAQAVIVPVAAGAKEPLAVGFFGSQNRTPLGAAQGEAAAKLLEALLARSEAGAAPSDVASENEDDIAARLARREAEQRAQAEFLAGLGHELKTPLNAIIGFSSLLEKQLRDEELLEEVEMISMSAEKLLALIDDLIDSYKIAAGKLTLHRSLSNINEVIANSVETIRVIADERNIRVRTYLDNNVPDFNFDTKRVQQVLVNLLGNAVKFVPSGGEIIVRSNSEADHVRVQVADTGEGIPPDVLPAIFERFKQAEGSEARDARSAGLGLALCKDFVEMHGGVINVTSEPHKGSIFSFTLPLEAPEGNEEVTTR